MRNVADGHLVDWGFLGDDGEKAYNSEVEERNPSFTDFPGEEPSETVFRRELAQARHPQKKKVAHHSKERKNTRQKERS